VSYDSDAAAIFAAFSIAPTPARKAIINAYIVGLKADGIWPLLDLLYLMAAADSQAGTINWKSPASFGLIGVNSPSFTADRGYTGNGTSSRLRTQYTPSVNGVNFQKDNASGWVWLGSNASSGATPDFGSTTAPRVVITGSNAGTASGDINTAAGASLSAAFATPGMIGIQRRASADRRFFLNGVQAATSATVSTGAASQEQWVCGANASAFSNKQQAMAAWGASLSGLEAAFYTRTLTYLQSVGAA
jgi:hypothetical protein